ncbi:YgeY family selenium metabolism-linked hydrolase, partial [Clostridium perfringens]|nr:YgeY family selenium metabolism-linked hydrolase [Clostridium perfringens]
MDFKNIKVKAEGYIVQMTKFLRDLVAIPGESCEEKGVVNRIAEEMRALGFNKVEIDPQGNVLGYMG